MALMQSMNSVNRAYCLLVFSILIIQLISLTAMAQQQCSDLVMNGDPDENYVNLKDASEKYETYGLSLDHLGQSCMQMKVQKDSFLKITWKKNGGTDTDLSFKLIRCSGEESQVIASETCEGFRSCSGADWREPKPYPVKAGDVLQWTFGVRRSGLSGKASIAIYSGDATVTHPSDQTPGKPLLDPQSASLDLNEQFSLSINSNNNARYNIDWGDGKIDMVEADGSGRAVLRGHSWGAPGTYRVQVRAKDEGGKESASSECIVTVNSIPSLRPAFRKPPKIAYANETCTFEINSGNAIGDIEYCIDWGDGNVTRTKKSMNCHRWATPREYDINVGFSYGNNATITWMSPAKIQVYKKEIMSESDDLQDAIDSADDFLELNLIDREYIISGGLQIADKNHLIISADSQSVIRGEGRIDIMIILNNSSEISLHNVVLSNIESGVKIINCNEISIVDTEVDFDGSGYGIRICSGNNIEIKNNIIKKIGTSRDREYPPVGIRVENGEYIDIGNNSVNEEHPPHPNPNPMVDYSIKSASYEGTKDNSIKLKNIKISIPRSERRNGIKYGNCDGTWDCEQDIIASVDGCVIPDDNPNNPCSWSINES
ncbi:MAG: hypothetical protein EHM14_09295 [Methanothrix sp.]|nr:MAG: hypothetical protein EHM14_09295 [Methanothrix sp.]